MSAPVEYGVTFHTHAIARCFHALAVCDKPKTDVCRIWHTLELLFCDSGAYVAGHGVSGNNIDEGCGFLELRVWHYAVKCGINN